MAQVKKDTSVKKDIEHNEIVPDKNKYTLWKACDEQTMVLNLPNGCIVMFDGGSMQFVPNVRWVDGKFQ